MRGFSPWSSLDPRLQGREVLRGHQIPSGKSGMEVQRTIHCLCHEASQCLSPEMLEAKAEGLRASAWR